MSNAIRHVHGATLNAIGAADRLAQATNHHYSDNPSSEKMTEHLNAAEQLAQGAISAIRRFHAECAQNNTPMSKRP